jgi:hypothetical protein
MSMSRALLTGLAIAATLGFHGCAPLILDYVHPVPVAEIDANGVRLTQARRLVRGNSAQVVMGVLGAPADQQTSCVPGEIAWRYPIRAWNDMANSGNIIHAPLLRATFDQAGLLTDWRFVDSVTARSLPVQESLDEAERWFQTLASAPPPTPPHITLGKRLIPGRTTMNDTESLLGQWHPDLLCGAGGLAPVLRETKTASGTVMEWYVDRPSPLFIPPSYLIATFEQAGTLIGWHFRQTYPGGRE